MLHLDYLVTRTPRLPHRRLGGLTQLAASAGLHVTVFMIGAWVISTLPGVDVRGAGRIAPQEKLDVSHIVFLAPDPRGIGRGGGGGGNQQPAPIRRAQGVGSDAVTLRVRKPPPATATASPAPAEDAPAIPAIVLDAKPLASGDFDQLGLPTGELSSLTSTGSGSGGGVGTGIGTGIGSGRGPGLGPGSGGGTGGGVYRAGGAVTPPRVIKEVKPSYTTDALLRRVQGTVVLELIVTSDGCASQIRVVRSLDPGGLDQQAVAATSQWLFEPGRLAGKPVDVRVLVMLDFWVR